MWRRMSWLIVTTICMVGLLSLLVRGREGFGPLSWQVRYRYCHGDFDGSRWRRYLTPHSVFLGDYPVATFRHPTQPFHVHDTIFPVLAVLLVVGLASVAVMTIHNSRRWFRRRRFECERCGYDLTGNVSGVCPECGQRISNGSAASHMQTS